MEMPVEISLAFREHPDENVLEEYAFGRLNEAEAAILEEHILVCEQCQLALVETDDYIRLMKSGAGYPPDLSIPPAAIPPAVEQRLELVTSGKST